MNTISTDIKENHAQIKLPTARHFIPNRPGIPTTGQTTKIRVQSSSSFVHENWRTLSANPIEDGRGLAADCLDGLLNCTGGRFLSPELFILLATPAYMEMALLPALRMGIERECNERLHKVVPLIVSAYRENIFQQSFAGHGAILICMGTQIGYQPLEARPDPGADTLNPS
jgi:hypothetical protein